MRVGLRQFHGKILFSPDDNPGGPPADPAADPPAPPSGDPPQADPPADPPVVKNTDSVEPNPPTDPPAPVEYNLTLPENAVIDDAVVERTVTTARELGLTPAAAQKTVELINSEVASRLAAELASESEGGTGWTQRIAAYETEALAAPDLGNGSTEKLAAVAGLATRALDKYFGDDIKQYLNETGLGSHPALLRGLSKIGKAMSEGTLQKQEGDPPPPPKRTADIMYDNTPQPQAQS